MAMSGHECFKLYLPLKLHFSKIEFNVWETKHLKNTGLDQYKARNDVPIFERLARIYKEPREFVKYCVANYAYHNKDFLYSEQLAEQNYTQWIKRKQSISRVFETDLRYIIDKDLRAMGIFDAYISGEITIETVTILNDINNVVDGWAVSKLLPVFPDEILVPLKLKRFVKYDEARIRSIYDTVLQSA